MRLKALGIDAVRGADSHGQGVDARGGNELFGVFRIGVDDLVGAALVVVVGRADGAQFGFHRHAHGMRDLHDLLGDGDVFLKRLGGASIITEVNPARRARRICCIFPP